MIEGKRPLCSRRFPVTFDRRRPPDYSDFYDIRWVKESGLESNELQHLKRIRHTKDPPSTSSLLLDKYRDDSDTPPSIPEDLALALSEPYVTEVPSLAAQTFTSLQHKCVFWPTVYSPKRMGESEYWTRGQAAWAWNAVKVLLDAAEQAQSEGEVITTSLILKHMLIVYSYRLFPMSHFPSMRTCKMIPACSRHSSHTTLAFRRLILYATPY